MSSLTAKNDRLTARVLQLEEGQFPDLEVVLNGLEDESESAARGKPHSEFAGEKMKFGVEPALKSGSEASQVGSDASDSGGVTTDHAQSSSESDYDVSFVSGPFPLLWHTTGRYLQTWWVYHRPAVTQ